MHSSFPPLRNSFKIASFVAFFALLIAAVPADSESTVYTSPISACKLEGAAIGVNGSTVVVNGVTITFSNWISKQGSPGEYIGFTIDKPGYIFTVKAGNELLSGMGTSWINPNGTSGSNAKAISNINFCMNDGNPNDKALCYLIADNDGFGSNSPDGLTKIDEMFNEVSIGLTGTDHIEALTQDTSTGILYGSDDKRFGRLNTTTGVFTFIGNFGSGGGAQGNIDFLDIDGLAYDPFTKKMYASVRRDGKDDVLIQVNIATGAAVPNAFGPGKTYVVVQPINGLQDIDDIAISTRNGVMYAIQNTNGNDSRLITIDKATGATTDIGDLDVPNVEGLGFHPDGRLLGVNGDSFRSMMQIPLDPFTGTTIPIESLGVNGWLDYEGISCLTETDNKIQGTVFVKPERIDLMLDKNATVTTGVNSDQIKYTVTVTNDNTNPVAGPNALTGTGLAGVTVKLYRDENVVGVHDGNDVFLASTVTGPGGTYSFPIAATGNFVVAVDLTSVPNLAYLPADNVEAVQFLGFGETLTGRDFKFYTFTSATGVTVSDVFPAGASFVNASATVGTYDSGTKIWTLGTLAPGASATLTLNATTTASGEIINCAEVKTAFPTDIDSTPGNGTNNAEDDRDCVPTIHRRSDIDLKLEKSADKTSIALGDNVVYTLTLTNESLANATNIVVTDELPYGAAFVSSTPAAIYDSNSHSVIWTVASLAGSAVTTLDIVVTFDGTSGTIPTGLFLADGVYQLRNHPDGAQAPPFYGLRLDKLFGDKTPITFDFNHASSNVRMSIEDGGQTAKIFGTSWGGHDTGAGFADAGLWNISFTFDNKMSVWGGDDDLVAQGGDAEQSTGTISPQYTTANFSAGQVYTLSDKESGGYSFRLGDRSDDLGHRGHSGISGWGWLNHNGNGVLDHKATSDFLFTAFPIPDGLNNCAQITSAGQSDTDSTPGNAPAYGQEDDDPCLRIPREEDPGVDIEVEKSASNMNPSIGDQIDYTILVTNNGPSTATNLEIKDLLPSGVTYVSHTPSAGVFNSGRGIWTIPTLVASGSATLVITVSIDGQGTGLGDGVYRLHNHPGVDLQPPAYGLRLDELFGGLHGITFDFDHVGSNLLLTINGSTINIAGQVFGGYDAGNAYDPALSGLWDVDFTYNNVVTGYPGDDDLYVKDANAETSTGTIVPQFSTVHFNAGDVFDLGDKSDGAYSFRMGDESNDLGYLGYTGISGWGWLKHGVNGNLGHTPISDWIFTAVPVRGSITNCAELTGLTEDDTDSTPNDGKGDDYSCVTIHPGDPTVDLMLNKDVDKSAASAGDILNYTLTLSNDAIASTTATNVVVVDNIPAGVTVLSTNPAANVVINNGAGTVTWTVPSLAPGASVVLQLQAQIMTAGKKTNCAQVVSADQSDVDDTYNDGTGEEYDCVVTNTNDPFIDLSVKKTAFPMNPGLGDVVAYTIRVSNDASATATAFGISVVDNVPAGLSIQSTNPVVNVSVNNATNVVSWFVPSLAPGAEKFLTIYAKVNQAGNWENCVEVMAATGTDTDSTPADGKGDDYDCVTTTTPDPTIDLSLIKTVNNATPTVGSTVTYTLSVSNDATATETATGVVVKDQLPAGVTIDAGFNNPNVTVSPSGLITWNVGSVSAGASKALQVPVTVTMSTAQVNCAQITAADQDDMDSTPDNGTGNGEDDQSCVTITPNLIPSNVMCYLVADNENHIGSADVLTYITSGGTEFSVGITGTQQINAIEFVGQTGKLYAADGNRFGTINPATGVFSAIGYFGSGLGTQGAKAFDDVDGLALDPYTGVLYATVRSANEDLLIQVNLVTGAAVTNAFGPGKTYVVIPAVGGFNDVDDIAIQLSTGTMYGVMNGNSGNTKLVSIDKSTGASALVSTLDVANVRGLAFRSNGQLIGTLGSTGNQARRITTATGVTTLDSNLGVNGNFDYEAITCNVGAPNLLSGTVFLDNNTDASLDAGDSGQKNVLVKLYKDNNNNGVLDGPDVLVGSLLSDVDGKYTFPILSTGRFIVTTDLGTYPAGAVLTTDNIETANFTTFGETDINNNFGFKVQAVVLGSIGDVVFNDTNANGVKDLGEGGIGGVLVRLYNGSCPAAGSPIATRVTSPTGAYSFTSLPAGTYCVDVVDSTVPAGYVHTTANDPMTVALANGQNFLFADFGYYYNLAAAQADLELSKEVDTSSPALDGVVEFTITVRNNGPAKATSLIVRDIIPVGLVFQDYNSTRGSYEANKLGFWTIGDLEVGQTEVLKIRTKVVITNMIENIAQVSNVDQEDPDSTPGNGVATEDDQDNAIVESRGPGSVGDIIRSECADMGTVNALIYSSYDNQIYAGTEVGSLHISNDDGANWPSFLQTDNSAPIRDIVVTSLGTVFAGSFGDGVYRSTNSGDSWTNIGPAAADVNDLDLDDNSNFLYAAVHGSVQVYNGATWSTVGAGSNPFAGEQVLAVVFDENSGRVVATSAGSGAYKFQGGTWTAVNTGLPIGKVNELFRGPNGEILAGTNGDGVYLFGGSMWIPFGTGLEKEPIESLGSGPNGELLAGARESGAYFYNFITNEWVSIGNLPIFTVASMTAGPLGEVYAGAPGEGIYVIYDENFDGIPDVAHQVANFMTSAIIQDIVVAPNGDMWAATYGYGILYSNDGGRCWTRMNRGLSNLWTFAIERATDGTLFIGIWADGKGGIWRSTDDGRNWEFLALPTRQIISLAIDPNNEQIIYAGANIAGEGALFRSTDGGDTWHSQGQFIQPVWSVTIDPDDSNHVLVGTLGDGIHESNDSGLTFAKIGSPINGLANPYVFDMAYAPFGTPYAGQLFAATDAGVYRYDEFAATWTLFGMGSANFQFRTLAFSGNSIYGGTWNAGVVEYDALTDEWGDYGLSDMPVIAFAMHPQTQTLIIGTSGSGVFLSTNFRMSTSIEDEVVGSEIPTSFALEANYPNPFNPQTTIPFSVSATGQVRLAIYDMLGREVGLLVDGQLAAGQYRITWEAGDRPSGSYLVRMDAGGQTFTRTMVLLK